MQDDISDGVAWLVKQGIADPKRVGIYGASYGGYATLAGVTFTPDLYAAAVDYVGVSNLFTFMQTIRPIGNRCWPRCRTWWATRARQGPPGATSPALHADRIKTPLFVAQGADPRVNKDESDQMVKALKARGVNVEYMVKDNEGHGFHNDENKFEFYEAMEKFLLQHLAVVAFDPAGWPRRPHWPLPPRPAPSSPRSRPRRNRPSRRFPPGRGPVPWRGTTPRRRAPGCRPPYRRAGGGKPPLTVILISPSTVCSGASRSASHTRCACTSALAGSQSYISNANSSPPRRPKRSLARTARCTTRAKCRSAWSPVA